MGSHDWEPSDLGNSIPGSSGSLTTLQNVHQLCLWKSSGILHLNDQYLVHLDFTLDACMDSKERLWK